MHCNIVISCSNCLSYVSELGFNSYYWKPALRAPHNRISERVQPGAAPGAPCYLNKEEELQDGRQQI